jgi:hypothetical protein
VAFLGEARGQQAGCVGIEGGEFKVEGGGAAAVVCAVVVVVLAEGRGRGLVGEDGREVGGEGGEGGGEGRKGCV